MDAVAVDVRSSATATVTLTARSRATIEGRVLELGTNTPLAGMMCRAALEVAGSETASVGGDLVIPNRSMTDATGKFTADAPIGHDRVICNGTGGVWLWSRAGGDVDTTVGTTHADVFAVKSTPPPSDVGFVLHRTAMPPQVTAVEPNNSLMVGDQLVMMDGISVANLLPDTVMMLAQNHRPGTAIVLQIMRGTTPMPIRVNTR